MDNVVIDAKKVFDIEVTSIPDWQRVIMKFNGVVSVLSMSPDQARQLAALLNEKANEMDGCN